MNLEVSSYIFEKSSNFKFHENPSSWSQMERQRDRQTERQTDRQATTKPLVSFCSFSKRP